MVGVVPVDGRPSLPMGLIAMNSSWMRCYRVPNRISPRVRVRALSTASLAPPRVCIVGAGPGKKASVRLRQGDIQMLMPRLAGFYTAQHLLKHHQTLTVDMLEQWPVPFGLVRYGVAPDHADVKNVTHSFSTTMEDPRFTFAGNVSYGRDVDLADLKRLYHAVVFATGAQRDKGLGLPNEDGLPHSIVPARAFVGWYNGHPDHVDLDPNLSTDTAIVIGNGNVAIDVARMLLRGCGRDRDQSLGSTDIAEHAWNALGRGSIQTVHIVGRRGPLQMSFTAKELRELATLSNVQFCLTAADQSLVEESANMPSLPRQQRRLLDILKKHALLWENSDPTRRRVCIHFCKSPASFLIENGSLLGLRVEQNKLEVSPRDVTQANAVGTGAHQTISGGLVIKSIGYAGAPLKDIPFLPKMGLIPNRQGHVESENGSLLPGVFVAGWAKRGPVGVIATTLADGRETGSTLLRAIENSALFHPLDSALPLFESGLRQLLDTRGVHYFTKQNWELLDSYETMQGTKCSKPRLKLTSTTEMIRFIDKSS